MTKSQKRHRFFLAYCAMFAECAAAGVTLVPYSYIRTAQQQKALYDDGKSDCNGLSRTSKHQDGLAIDAFVLDADGQTAIWDGNHAGYKTMAQIAKKHGLKSRITLRSGAIDANHVEWDDVFAGTNGRFPKETA